jgi:ABC-2 type transport system permease protein
MDWSQLRTILWLRWRLTRNQWSRGGTVNAVLSIIVMFFLFLLGAAGGIAGIIFGAFVLDNAKGITLLGVWDVIIFLFLLFWLIGLVSEIQRSETIDIGKLLHLPVLLKDVFFINYIASNATLSIIIFAPLMLGLCIGLALGYSWMMIVMLPLVIGFIFMISSWTYCLRGWLVTLMKNQRRRRTVIAVVTFCFLVITQLPNLIGNFYGHRERHRPGTDVSSQSQKQTGEVPPRISGRTIPPSLLFAHKIVPFLWVGNGAKSLTDNSPWAAVLGTAGTFGLGWLGIRRAYRTTIRFYQGAAAGSKIKKKTRKEKTVTFTKNSLAESLPFVSDEASALAMAFFQNLKRAPEIKMMLATNLFMMLFFSMMMFFQHPGSIGSNFKPFITVGVIMFSFFGLVQLMFNQFGYDRSGFRLLVLSPVSRKYILQGKNLAFSPVAMCIGGFLLLIVKLLLRIPFFTFLASIFQLITAYLLLSIVGNLISIINPYRIAPGSMKPTKMSTLNVILLVLSNLLFSIAIIPIVIPPAAELLLTKVISMPAGLFNLCLSAILLPVTVFFYKRSLTHLGNLLQKREKKILEIVTREIE